MICWAVIFLGTLLNSSVHATIEFAAFGDWGLDTAALRQTADSLNSMCPSRSFTVLLGDNAYPAGMKSASDATFGLFSSTVAGTSSVPHHLVLGNHDYMGDWQSEFLYSTSDMRWDFPSRYYKRLYASSDQSVRACMLFIDTVRPDPAQLTWLISQLTSTDCDPASVWTIVSGHYPIWSTGAYSDSTYLTTNLLPILHQYGVKLYLAGHEHLHHVFFDGQLVQVTSGASAQSRNALQFKSDPKQIWGVSGTSISGFVRVVASESALSVSIISSNNRNSFVEFDITRSGTRESMFNHILWTSGDSNMDARVAANSGGGEKASESIQVSAVLFLAVLVCFSF